MWLGNLHHIGKVGNETAHAITAFDTDFHDIAQVFGIFHGLQGIVYRIEGRGDSSYGVVHFVGNHADDFLVSLLFRFHHFGSQAFNQIERVGETTVHKRKAGASVDAGVAQTYGGSSILGHPVQLFGQGAGQLIHGLVQDFFFRSCIQEFQGGFVGHGNPFVEGKDDDSHGGYADQQVQEMVLFAKAETFFLQLVHHAIEDGHDAVGFPLPDRCQPAAEILCLKQIHTAGNGVQGLDDLFIEIDQIDEAECDDAFYQIKPPSVFLCGDKQQYNPYRH